METLTLHCAVIEWPSILEPLEPSLIVARTERERDKKIADEIIETAGALAEPDWRDAIDANSTLAGNNWEDWLEPLDETSYGQPYVTTYTKEV